MEKDSSRTSREIRRETYLHIKYWDIIYIYKNKKNIIVRVAAREKH